ncbi:unnamed protein product [Angiostrongylus costaricensis]|uniref:Homeobox domain-containing protein n=1 Tax=Angiostrongylus costaricensis TaxID=334426 RepID=A0A158PIL6_ANGCS|nr:unnamed protein product [Angiostrongylus costaricensis]
MAESDLRTDKAVIRPSAECRTRPVRSHQLCMLVSNTVGTEFLLGKLVVAQNQGTFATSPSRKSEQDVKTLNKRRLTAESLYDLYSMPCPFSNRDFTELASNSQQTINKRELSAESQHDIRRILSPFEYKKENIEQVDYHSPRPSMVDPGPPYLLTECDYDYTSYSQPMMPAPYYAPALSMPPPHVNPYYYYRPPTALYHYQVPIPMYNLGIPYHLNSPMKAPSSSSSEFSKVDTETDNMRIPNQFCPNPQQVPLRRPTTPNNKTINKHIRGVDSVADLNRLDVHFEPRIPLSYAGSQEGNSDCFVRPVTLDVISFHFSEVACVVRNGNSNAVNKRYAG